MPALVAALAGMFLTIATSLVGRVLLALGIGYVTYKGIDASTTFLMNQIKDSMAGMPSEILNFLAFCWVDKAIGLIASTWTATAAMTGIGSGLTKFKLKGGS